MTVPDSVRISYIDDLIEEVLERVPSLPIEITYYFREHSSLTPFLDIVIRYDHHCVWRYTGTRSRGEEFSVALERAHTEALARFKVELLAYGLQGMLQSILRSREEYGI